MDYISNIKIMLLLGNTAVINNPPPPQKKIPGSIWVVHIGSFINSSDTVLMTKHVLGHTVQSNIFVAAKYTKLT